jgi:hypothetical protein
MTGRLDWRSGGAVIQMSIARLACTACGAEANASCNCGKPYIPAPRERAKEAVKANPQKSDRAIAKEIGVDHKTVGAARKETTGECSPVESRVGQDGKTRRLPAPKEIEDNDYDPDDAERREKVRKYKQKQRPRDVTGDEGDIDDSNIEEDIEPENYRTAYLLRTEQARRFAVYSGKVTKEIVEEALGVAATWQSFSQELEARYAETSGEDATGDASAVGEPHIGKDGKTRRSPSAARAARLEQKSKQKQQSGDAADIVNRAMTRPLKEFDPGDATDDEFVGRQFLFIASDIVESGAETIEHLNKNRVHASMLAEALTLTEQVIEQWGSIRSLLLDWSKTSRDLDIPDILDRRAERST